jgi:hypothetical protein
MHCGDTREGCLCFPHLDGDRRAGDPAISDGFKEGSRHTGKVLPVSLPERAAISLPSRSPPLYGLPSLCLLDPRIIHGRNGRKGRFCWGFRVFLPPCLGDFVEGSTARHDRVV